jgi:hypothetical protein
MISLPNPVFSYMSDSFAVKLERLDKDQVNQCDQSNQCTIFIEDRLLFFSFNEAPKAQKVFPCKEKPEFQLILKSGYRIQIAYLPRLLLVPTIQYIC